MKTKQQVESRIKELIDDLDVWGVDLKNASKNKFKFERILIKCAIARAELKMARWFIEDE